MDRFGLLIDYEFCTGCHTCEMACKAEHEFLRGKWGIQLAHIGPWQIDDERWEQFYVPIPTELCDLCEDRVSKGKLPTCVHHCQAQVMEYGPITELVKKATKAKTVLFIPR